jgi:hypothetical protein
MTTRRDKALAELRLRISEQRARLDPKVLKMAERAARSGNAGEKLPYDRESALKAVELFLQSHDDRGDFERRLRAALIRDKN